jgi:hypothetical protein
MVEIVRPLATSHGIGYCLPPIRDDAPTELAAISFAASIKIMLLRSNFYDSPVETDDACSTRSLKTG